MFTLNSSLHTDLSWGRRHFHVPTYCNFYDIIKYQKLHRVRKNNKAINLLAVYINEAQVESVVQIVLIILYCVVSAFMMCVSIWSVNYEM